MPRLESETSTHPGLFDDIFGLTGLRDSLGDDAWIAAMLRVEAALAMACADIGIISRRDAETVSDACAALRVDPAELGAESASGGNPVIALVRRLRAAAPVDPSRIHVGATSQDIMDTALALMLRDAGDQHHLALRSACLAGAELAGTHRGTPVAARTLGQQALPTTFGALVATWIRPLINADREFRLALDNLPVQFGGAAGTLAAVHPNGLELSAALADRLGLPRYPGGWHTDRSPLLRVACSLAMTAGAVSKCAADVIAMAATEIGEISESNSGGSSAMPHKRNPVAAITARAAARRVPGLLSTMAANMDHEFARAAGAWHAEWLTMTGLMTTSIGAARRIASCLNGLQVHVDAMTHNLNVTRGALLAERVVGALSAHTTQAREIVTDVCASGGELTTEPRILEYLSVNEVGRLLDPTGYLGHAPDLVDLVVGDVYDHFGALRQDERKEVQ